MPRWWSPILLFGAAGLRLAVPHMTPPFLFTWTLMVILYVIGRVSWDMIRRGLNTQHPVTGRPAPRPSRPENPGPRPRTRSERRGSGRRRRSAGRSGRPPAQPVAPRRIRPPPLGIARTGPGQVPQPGHHPPQGGSAPRARVGLGGVTRPSMADYVGAVDQGTTSTRFMIFDHAGNEVGKHQLEHEQILPHAGWVEHNPVEIWERTGVVIRARCTRRSARRDLAALGVTNQRETTVVWNGGPGARTTTRSSGRTPGPTASRPPSTGTAAATDPAQGRPAARHLLLRRQDPVDPGERRGGAGGGGARRGGVR